MLDFRLETFLSVCDTMNYRRSAELLHITQPAVTQHIQHLEKFYGHKLFRYEGRRLKKTAAAELLEQYARTMKINEADMLRQMDERQIHDLRIGVTKTIAQCVIGQYAEHFLRCPDNDLTLIDENTQNLLDLIDQCKLDFALIEGIFDRRKYGSIRFSTEPFVGICAPDHPFAHQEVTIAQLLDQTLLCREEGSGTRAILENKLLDYNRSIYDFRRCICISTFSLILDFVRKGLGVSFVYEVLARQQGLPTFTIRDCQIRREFNFVFLRSTGAEDKIRRFIGYLPSEDGSHHG